MTSPMSRTNWLEAQAARITKLQAENERMRAALTKIISLLNFSDPFDQESYAALDVAKAALYKEEGDPK